MEFSTNSPIIFALVGVIILVVLAQSVYFLLRAVKRATIHGNNERVRLEGAKKAIEFYIRLMKQC